MDIDFPTYLLNISIIILVTAGIVSVFTRK